MKFFLGVVGGAILVIGLIMIALWFYFQYTAMM